MAFIHSGSEIRIYKKSRPKICEMNQFHEFFSIYWNYIFLKGKICQKKQNFFQRVVFGLDRFNFSGPLCYEMQLNHGLNDFIEDFYMKFNEFLFFRCWKSLVSSLEKEGKYSKIWIDFSLFLYWSSCCQKQRTNFTIFGQ